VGERWGNAGNASYLRLTHPALSVKVTPHTHSQTQGEIQDTASHKQNCESSS